MNRSDFSADIAAALATLKDGGIIVYPTDTVWGIGCDATNPEAVRKVFEIKQRDDAKALITLVGSLAMLERTVEEIPEAAEQIVEVALEPITIIYDRASKIIAPNLIAEDGSIAVRVTSDPFSSQLSRAFGRPLVSTSANISGQPTPMDFKSISSDILNKADYVCTSRREEIPAQKTSSIIKISKGGLFKIIRK